MRRSAFDSVGEVVDAAVNNGLVEDFPNKIVIRLAGWKLHLNEDHASSAIQLLGLIAGRIEEVEMRRTFNMGIGMVLVVYKEAAHRMLGNEGQIQYTALVLDLVSKGGVKGIAHITGGGFTDNIPRVFPTGLGAAGRIEEVEMRRTFNMGIGMVLVVDKEAAHRIIGV
ncbi:hypothetical protein ACH5RR_019097 [Cinchona calisaya]|uniref:phosphoribosylformylglycinamidine cyclo-ligase n=1 Tax=Cinchona calisaya TaxID=153742 RepID=A0ABD2ZNW4_9GENT